MGELRGGKDYQYPMLPPQETPEEQMAQLPLAVQIELAGELPEYAEGTGQTLEDFDNQLEDGLEDDDDLEEDTVGGKLQDPFENAGLEDVKEEMRKRKRKSSATAERQPVGEE